MKRHLTILLLCLTAWHRSEAQTGKVIPAGRLRDATAIELPLPRVPATLREPGKRAEYILTHFWDAMDFRDTTRSLDKEFMEQNFVNFANLFQYTDTAVIPSVVHILMKKAEAMPQSYTLIGQLAEKYLYDMDSPMYNEEQFIPFLKEYVSTAVLTEYEKIRPAYMLNDVLKNRTGSTATDFTYVARHGARRTLHSTESEKILLLFYDPACENCKRTIEELSTCATLQDMVSEKRLTVLAVSPYTDEKSRRTKNGFPKEWTVGTRTGDILEKELYAIRRIPTLYLLDKDKKIIAKDISTQTLFSILSQTAAQNNE